MASQAIWADHLTISPSKSRAQLYGRNSAKWGARVWSPCCKLAFLNGPFRWLKRGQETFTGDCPRCGLEWLISHEQSDPLGSGLVYLMMTKGAQHAPKQPGYHALRETSDEVAAVVIPADFPRPISRAEIREIVIGSIEIEPEPEPEPELQLPPTGATKATWIAAAGDLGIPLSASQCRWAKPVLQGHIMAALGGF